MFDDLCLPDLSGLFCIFIVKGSGEVDFLNILGKNKKNNLGNMTCNENVTVSSTPNSRVNYNSFFYVIQCLNKQKLNFPQYFQNLEPENARTKISKIHDIFIYLISIHSILIWWNCINSKSKIFFLESIEFYHLINRLRLLNITLKKLLSYI